MEYIRSGGINSGSDMIFNNDMSGNSDINDIRNSCSEDITISIMEYIRSGGC